ncbi:MAG: hypothetical protein ACC642_05500, partial [Pseudomonadales bacterium]
MKSMASGSHEQWSSKFGFLMASIGFAVGLGNIWRFPYITGENGGGAFIIVYLICVFCIGAPILIGEIMIGRKGRMSPIAAMRNVAIAEGRGTGWQWVGGMNLFTAFIIEVVYCVVSGWVLYYLYVAVTSGFEGVDPVVSAARFDTLMADVPGMLFWTVVGLAVTGTIVFFGVQKGIERAVRVLMPMLFGLMVLLAGYNVFAGGFPAVLDPSTLDGANGFQINGINAGDRSGWSVSGAGDVNGDGFDDMIIGAVFADPNGRDDAGESYVLFGKSGGFSAVIELSTLDGANGFRIEGLNAGDRMGGSVSGAGDVNGDGFDDLII